MKKTGKQLLCGFAAAVLALSLTACGKGQSADGLDAKYEPPADAGPLTMVSGYNLYRQGNANDQGYYEIFKHTEQGNNVVYTDFATSTRLYLCNQPDCLHRDENCPSYNAEFRYPELLPTESGLYIFQDGGYTMQGKDADRPKIWRMELDGSNQELVYTFANANQPDFDNNAVTDGERLYFKMDVFDKETCTEEEYGQIVEERLMCFDLKNEKLMSVCDIHTGYDANQFLVGCTGRNIVLRESKSLPNPKDQEKGANTLWALNVDTGEKRKINEEPIIARYDSNWTGPDQYVWWDNGGQTCHTLDYATGETATVQLERPIPQESRAWFAKDKHLVLSWEVNGRDQCFAADLTTGAVQPILTAEDHGEKAGQFPCCILAETEDSYLVEVSHENASITWYNPDGTTEKATWDLPRQAWIPKEDYWSGNAEHVTPIQDLVA